MAPGRRRAQDPRSPVWALRTALEPSRRPASAGGFRSSWTEVAGVRVHARSAGGPPDARPVVLAPGIGLSYRYMMPLAAVLAVSAPVHVVDLPGGGLSDKPGWTPGLATQAGALLGWLEARGLSYVALVAN